MSELLKSINTRVVGVSFQNDDGTDRQEILSGLSVGEGMLLKYFEYENEPAYAVTDAAGNRIGSLSKELAADIYRKYKDCYFSVMISDITGGDDGRKYGCIIDIDIYDTVPDVVKTPAPTVVPKTVSISEGDSKSMSAGDIVGGIGAIFKFFVSLIKLAFWLAVIIGIVAILIWIF